MMVGLLQGLFAVAMITSTVVPFVNISFAEEQDNEQDEEKGDREQQREESRGEAREEARDEEESKNDEDADRQESKANDDERVEERTRQTDQGREQSGEEVDNNNAVEENAINEQQQEEEVKDIGSKADPEVAGEDVIDTQRLSRSEAPQLLQVAPTSEPLGEPQLESLEEDAPIAVEQQAEPPKSVFDIQLERIGQVFAENLDPNSPGNQALVGALVDVAGQVAEEADLENIPKNALKYVVAARLALPVLSQLDTANTLLSNAEAIEKVNAQLDNALLLRLGIAPGVIPPLTPVPATCPPGQTGTPPNCTPTPPEQCPPGQTGTPPNCTPTPPPTGGNAGEFRDPNAPDGACSSLIGSSFEPFYDHCISDEPSRCSAIDPFDNSVCDTYIIPGGHGLINDDPERAGGNGYSTACKPGFAPVVVGYNEFSVPPTPILDCQ